MILHIANVSLLLYFLNFLCILFSPSACSSFNFDAQFKPRTGAQGLGRTDGVNFCKRNHAPGWLVPTWKATRSASTLIGNSKSFVDGELSGNDCCTCGTLGELRYAVSAR